MASKDGRRSLEKALDASAGRRLGRWSMADVGLVCESVVMEVYEDLQITLRGGFDTPSTGTVGLSNVWGCLASQD